MISIFSPHKKKKKKTEATFTLTTFDLLLFQTFKTKAIRKKIDHITNPIKYAITPQQRSATSQLTAHTGVFQVHRDWKYGLSEMVNRAQRNVSSSKQSLKWPRWAFDQKNPQKTIFNYLAYLFFIDCLIIICKYTQRWTAVFIFLRLVLFHLILLLRSYMSHISHHPYSSC